MVIKTDSDIDFEQHPEEAQLGALLLLFRGTFLAYVIVTEIFAKIEKKNSGKLEKWMQQGRLFNQVRDETQKDGALR